MNHVKEEKEEIKSMKMKRAQLTERIALSFALSIAVVPLAVFYLNLIGVRINTVNSFFTILGIIAVSLGVLYVKNYIF